MDQTDPLSAVGGARLHLLLSAAAGPGRLTAGRRLLVYRHAGAGPVRLQPRRRRLDADAADGQVPWRLEPGTCSRGERSTSLDNYSIMRHADAVRDLGSGVRFSYRIETQAEKSRQCWGGIWVTPRSYSFMAETPDQTEVICVRQLDKLTYKNDGINRRMPWLSIG